MVHKAQRHVSEVPPAIYVFTGIIAGFGIICMQLVCVCRDIIFFYALCLKTMFFHSIFVCMFGLSLDHCSCHNSTPSDSIREGKVICHECVGVCVCVCVCVYVCGVMV